MNKIIYGAMSFFPVLALAQVTTPLATVRTLVEQARGILGLLIPMAFGLAILFFFYGVAKYISAAGEQKKAEEGKSIMIYGIIGIAVMASVWGLVSYLQGALGVNSGASIQVPTVPGL